MPSKVLTHRVTGKEFKDEETALIEFWKRMASNLRVKTPQEIITIDHVDFDKHMGWEITYVVDDKDLPKAPEPKAESVQARPEEPIAAKPYTYTPPKPRPKCHVLSCMDLSIEGSSYCAKHQDGVARFSDTQQPTEIMPSLISISGWNPRTIFDRAKLEELKRSIEEHGILEPLLVRPKGNARFELVIGERRLRAARELKLEHVPVTVRQLTDGQVLEIMLAENLQREDLSPIEEAHHLKRVLEMNKDLTQTELGKRLGKSQEWVSGRLRLVGLPSFVQDAIIARAITPSAAIDLQAWENTEHYETILKIVKQELDIIGEVTVRMMSGIIKDVTEPVPKLTDEQKAEIDADPFPEIEPEPVQESVLTDVGTQVHTEEDDEVHPAGSAWKEDDPEPSPLSQPAQTTVTVNGADRGATKSDDDEDVPEQDENEEDTAAEGTEEEDPAKQPEASDDLALPDRISCRCRDYGSTMSKDRVQAIIDMMEHLVGAAHSSISPKCHQKALHKLAAAMGRSPEVMAVLRDQFTGGML